MLPEQQLHGAWLDSVDAGCIWLLAERRSNNDVVFGVSSVCLSKGEFFFERGSVSEGARK